LRLTIIILITVLSIGSVVISLGYLTTPEYLDVPEISSQYEKLEKYKNELEKINQYNQEILKDLESQIKNSDDVHIEQINEEIKVIKEVIEKNKAELEQVIAKLSQMESDP
jgi:seryl-tRNA synthetase